MLSSKLSALTLHHNSCVRSQCLRGLVQTATSPGQLRTGRPFGRADVKASALSCLPTCRARADCSHRRQTLHVVRHSKPLVICQQHPA